MRILFFSLAIFFLSLIQVTLVKINLLLILVLFFAFLGDEFWALAVAFFAGMVFDFFKGGILGVSSLGFLLVSFFIIIYRRNFLPIHPLFLFVSTLLSSFIFAQITKISWSFFEGLVLAGIVFLLRFFLPGIFQVLKPEQIKV